MWSPVAKKDEWKLKQEKTKPGEVIKGRESHVKFMTG